MLCRRTEAKYVRTETTMYKRKSKHTSTFLPLEKVEKKRFDSIWINSVIVTFDANHYHSEFCHYSILNELLRGLDKPGAGDTISFVPGEFTRVDEWRSERGGHASRSINRSRQQRRGHPAQFFSCLLRHKA